MKVGVSCIITPGSWTTEETLTKAKGFGYDTIELVCRDKGPITLDTPESELKGYAAKAQEIGIELSSLCLSVTSCDIMTNDAAAREANIQTIVRGLKVAKAMGIGACLVVPGRIGPDCYYDDAYYNALTACRKLGPLAAEVGVAVALEYVWNWFLVSPLEYKRFLDEVDNPYIGFFYDTGNMVIQGYPEMWARILGRHIKRVHLKDFRRQGAQWPPLLEGDVDFAAVMRELRATGFDGALLSEVDSGIASFEETANAIRKIIQM